jgi:hypothetical protein
MTSIHETMAEETITDEEDQELARLALEADPDVHVADDAISVWEVIGPGVGRPLPDWYMPAPMGTPHFSGWRRHLVRFNVGLIVAAFLSINAAGLCNTYGQLHF